MEDSLSYLDDLLPKVNASDIFGCLKFIFLYISVRKGDNCPTFSPDRVPMLALEIVPKGSCALYV